MLQSCCVVRASKAQLKTNRFWAKMCGSHAVKLLFVLSHHNSHTPRYHPLKPLRSRLVSIPSGPELTASFCFKPWPNQVCESQLPLLLVIHTLPLQELAFLASKLISKPSITNSNTAATSIYMFNGWCKYKFTHVTLSMATLVFAV